MQRQSYHAKTVLEQKGAGKTTFLAFKDSLGNPLSRSPIEKIIATGRGLVDGTVYLSITISSIY